MSFRRSLPFLLGLIAALLTGWVIFPEVLYKSYDQPVQFSHKAHGEEGAGMACEDCHSFFDDGRFAGIPPVAKCAECHSDPMTDSPNEIKIVEEYIRPNREIPWLAYSRQPENAFFSHAVHVKRGGVECKECHGDHGQGDSLRLYQVNRITGYSRDIWGSSMARMRKGSWDGMKMDDCADCHTSRNVPNTCFGCHK